MQKINTITVQTLIELLSSVISGKEVFVDFSAVSLSELYSFAKFHSVELLVFDKLKAFQAFRDNPIYPEWERKAKIEIIKSGFQMNEFQSLVSLFEKQGIHMMPMKGTLLRSCYPNPRLRQMADIDLFVNKTQTLAAKELLEANGYQTEVFQEGESVFSKPPFLKLEMHDTLCEFDAHERYFKDYAQKLSLMKNYRFIYQMNKNDFFIYLIYHISKHLYSGGIGMKSFFDIYVFLHRFADELDRDYIKSECKKLDIYPLCDEIESLVYRWFHDCRLNMEDEFEKYIIYSGTFGTHYNKILNNILSSKHKGNIFHRFVYNIKRLMIPKEEMYAQYASLQKRKWLLPVYYLHRIFVYIPKLMIQTIQYKKM